MVPYTHHHQCVRQQVSEVDKNYLMQLQKLLIGQFLQRQCQLHS